MMLKNVLPVLSLLFGVLSLTDAWNPPSPKERGRRRYVLSFVEVLILVGWVGTLVFSILTLLMS